MEYHFQLYAIDLTEANDYILYILFVRLNALRKWFQVIYFFPDDALCGWDSGSQFYVVCFTLVRSHKQQPLPDFFYNQIEFCERGGNLIN